MFDIDFPLMKDIIMKKWVEKKYTRRENIHCSSLLHCRRKVAYERLDPKSHILDLDSKVNQRSVRYYILGEAQHRYLKEVLGDEDYKYEKTIVYTCKTGLKVVGHCDIVDKRDGTIIEVKTAHTTKVLKEAYPYHYQQLAMYLAITGAKKGILFYIIMGETFNTSEYFAQYNMTLDESQRQRILEKVDRHAIELQNGIEKNVANLVGHIADSLTYLNNGNNWYCSSCPYRSQCSGYLELFGPQGKPLDQSKLLGRTVERLKQEAVKKTI